MSQELQNNQVSLTTTDIVFGETSKFKYPKSAKEFCWTCQDYASVLGHSSVNCPETICLNCLEHGLTVKGHNATICLNQQDIGPSSRKLAWIHSKNVPILIWGSSLKKLVPKLVYKKLGSSRDCCGEDDDSGADNNCCRHVQTSSKLTRFKVNLLYWD